MLMLLWPLEQCSYIKSCVCFNDNSNRSRIQTWFAFSATQISACKCSDFRNVCCWCLPCKDDLDLQVMARDHSQQDVLREDDTFLEPVSFLQNGQVDQWLRHDQMLLRCGWLSWGLDTRKADWWCPCWHEQSSGNAQEGHPWSLSAK